MLGFIATQGRLCRAGGALGLLVGFSLTLAACGSPISVERQDARTVRTELTSNALTTGRLSGSTQIALRRLDLLSLSERDMPAAIRAVNQIAIANPSSPDLLFTLAEMAFQEGERGNDRSYFLATVVYAYLYLFPARAEDRPNPFDPRLRAATDLYNLALTRGLASEDGTRVELRPGEYRLPFGTLTIAYDPSVARWAGRGLSNFIPAAELQVTGLQNRYRETGLGAPLAASISRIVEPNGLQVASNLKQPVTALLLLDGARDSIGTGRFNGRLMLYPGNEQREVEIAGQRVPLEIEPTTAFAYALSDSAIWRSEIAGFFQGDLFDTLPSQLFGLEPYRPGRIPVVLIHGTASSAGRWADMINDLRNDPAIRDRFQFWLFVYNTGNPVPLSALRLREALEATLAGLDPEGRDPMLRQMVLIGHSQGGLLAKMLTIESGSRLYDQFSSRPLDDLALSDDVRTTLRRSLFVTPMHGVSRVVFIATPHRGSFRASITIGRLISQFMTLPLGVTRLFTETLTGNADALRMDPRHVRLGSVYAMTPGSPFSTTVSAIPVSSGISAHSIIAIGGDGQVETGDDGVVEYSSAHIDEAKSELIVRSGHSVQAHPRAVGEVRRILLEHWTETCPDGCDRPTRVATMERRPGRRSTTPTR